MPHSQAVRMTASVHESLVEIAWIIEALRSSYHLAENPSKGAYSLMNCAMRVGRGMTPRHAATRGKGYSRVTVVTASCWHGCRMIQGGRSDRTRR